MIHREHQQLRRTRRACGCAVHVLQLIRIAQAPRPLALEKRAQLGPGGHRGCTAVARDHDRAAGIPIPATGRDRQGTKPAAQEPAHERVAGAQDVENLDIEAGCFDAAVQRRADHAFECDAAVRSQLAYQYC